MTREDIQAEPWIGEQRERVSALLDRAEVAERGVMSLRAELEAAREFGNAECAARQEAQAEVARLRADYEGACKLVAQMHAAARGGRVGDGPVIGVLEDVEAMRSDLAAERAATTLLDATVTTLTEQVGLCAAEAERMRAALTGVRKRVDFVFGTTQNVMWERFLHEQRESIDAALVSPSTAARVLRDRDERVRCETKTALEEENP